MKIGHCGSLSGDRKRRLPSGRLGRKALSLLGKRDFHVPEAAGPRINATGPPSSRVRPDARRRRRPSAGAAPEPDSGLSGPSMSYRETEHPQECGSVRRRNTVVTRSNPVVLGMGGVSSPNLPSAPAPPARVHPTSALRRRSLVSSESAETAASMGERHSACECAALPDAVSFARTAVLV